VRALSAFVADVYGEQRIIEAGVVPASVLDGAEGFEPDLRGRWPAGAEPVPIAGLDVVTGPDGVPVVLEDNLRTPSGLAYAMAAERAVAQALPLAPPPRVLLRDALLPALRALVPAGQHAVVLTDGEAAATHWEHRTLAGLLGARLATPDRLRRRGAELWVQEGDDGPASRVEAVYRRADEDRLRDEHGRATWLSELLLEPWLAGRLTLVNPPGTGVADDKLAYAHVEAMVRFYLGEEPLVRSIPTLDLADPAQRDALLADLRGHVVKPRFGQGGTGVVIGAHALEADLQRTAAAVLEDPERWIAQPLVPLSLHPTVIDGRLEPRHVDLRPFVLTGPDGPRALPGGLTRMAWDAGALVVNSSSDGGAKATWVLR
jgi:uncharacterized circularly permuted ATP-grasp superfamily protein